MGRDGGGRKLRACGRDVHIKTAKARPPVDEVAQHSPRPGEPGGSGGRAEALAHKYSQGGWRLAVWPQQWAHPVDPDHTLPLVLKQARSNGFVQRTGWCGHAVGQSAGA